MIRLIKRILVLVLLATSAVAVYAQTTASLPPPDPEQVLPLDTNALATLAVQEHGRKKPFTTFSHEMLLSMSGVGTLPIVNPDGSKVTLPAEQVMLDLWLKPEGWDDRPIVMLNFLELKKR